jgi:hypothetical protein
MAVDVQAFATTYGEDVRRARTDALLAFRESALEYLKAHPDKRGELLEELKRLRAEFREAGREDLEDLVLDAMDIMTGWVRPDVRV